MPQHEARRPTDHPQAHPRRRGPRASSARAAACLATSLLACAQPLPRGDGPATLVVHASEIETPSGRMVGRARIEVIDYEDSCPRLFDRTLLGMRKAVEVVNREDGPVRIGLVPGHVYKVSLQHRGAGDARDRACEVVFWFSPAAGSQYEVALRSDIDHCSAAQPESRTAVLEPFATCEQARAGIEPGSSAPGSASGTNR